MEKKKNKKSGFFRYIFGSTSYGPPEFISHIRQSLNKLALFIKNQNNKFKTAKPGLYSALRIGIPVICIIAIALGIWYALQPEPEKFRMSIVPPGLTRLEKNALPGPLLIRFNGSVARLEEVDKFITKGIEISPEIPDAAPANF